MRRAERLRIILTAQGGGPPVDLVSGRRPRRLPGACGRVSHWRRALLRL